MRSLNVQILEEVCGAHGALNDLPEVGVEEQHRLRSVERQQRQHEQEAERDERDDDVEEAVVEVGERARREHHLGERAP